MTSEQGPAVMNAVDQLVHTTIRIETVGTNGQGSGTGFFMTLCNDGHQNVPVVVTNKHVIDGAHQGVLFFTRSKHDEDMPDLGNNLTVTIDDFARGWLLHPDTDVDLAVLPIGPILEHLAASGEKVFFKAFGTDLIAEEDFLVGLTAIEDVLMLGYPNGLWDPKHNLPITRRGVTATPPGVAFNGRQEFVIDCACFPGSSGSPVLLFNSSGYVNKATGETMLGGRVKLLGVLWGGPQFNAVGDLLVVPVPTTQASKDVALSRIPMNLGYCVRATQLRWFEEHFQKVVEAQRKANTEVTVKES